MSDVTFTFEVDEDLKNEFTAAADATDSDSAQVLRDLMRDFVRRQHEAADYDAWFRAQVQIGLDQARAGDLFSHEEVEAEAAAWRADLERKLGRRTI
ncbi:hypothetical protein [Zavarzinia compransoris]|uniref:Antitoxin of toxin-antitoxin stability system n=1 Tax=Zavarzinia compransoris TaxID=1264899 RepID=A0A317E8Z7_9PROT|nr:hypothetical protein [Zavarzinia compransoris]PWR21783.1 hypothetical protein DKG75_07275 [Zavarzinia compransoris]TDP45418.1 putative transcriptional regulator [Zavarzinia compransoris]